jgi:hypothetical protein
MLSPDWKFTETLQKRIRVTKVDKRERHLDAQDIEGGGLPFCLDVAEGLDLGKVKPAKIYRATIKIFTAELGGDLERHLIELSFEDAQLRRSLQVIKQTGSVLKRFELVAVK